MRPRHTNLWGSLRFATPAFQRRSIQGRELGTGLRLHMPRFATFRRPRNPLFGSVYCPERLFFRCYRDAQALQCVGKENLTGQS
jgi:hypothetical protein